MGLVRGNCAMLLGSVALSVLATAGSAVADGDAGSPEQPAVMQPTAVPASPAGIPQATGIRRRRSARSEAATIWNGEPVLMGGCTGMCPCDAKIRHEGTILPR